MPGSWIPSPNPAATYSIDQVAIRDADSLKVRQLLLSHKKTLSKNLLLQKNNPFRDNSKRSRLRAQTLSGGCATQYGQYVAISNILHCIDGWDYLGAALRCAVFGQTHLARHLAYYAELRAVHSILSGNGIAIMNGTHYSVTSGDVKRIAAGKNRASGGPTQTLGTHEAAWEIFDIATNGGVGTGLLSIIQPQGFKLSDWVSRASGASSARKLLKDWGIDLKIFSTDRDARNASSYGPVDLQALPTKNLTDLLLLIKAIWQLSEPIAQGNTFSRLDLQLLKHISKSSSIKNSIILRSEELLGRSSPTSTQLQAFIIGTSVVPEPIKWANQKPIIEDPEFYLQVLSRAFLLLRIASGVTSNLFKDVSLGLNEMGFWWKDHAVRHGISVAVAPNLPINSWADVRLQIDELDLFLSGTGSPTVCDLINYRSAQPNDQSSLSRAINILTQMDHIFLWNLPV